MVMPPSVSLPYFGMQHTPPAPYRHELPSSIGSSVHYHATPHNYFLDPLGRPYMYNPTTQTVTNRPNSAPSSHRHHTTPQPADEWRQDELLEDALTIGPAPVDYGFGYGPRRAADEKPAGFVRMIVTPPRASSRPPVLHRRPQYQYELEHKPATARKSVTRDEHNHRILAFKNQPREDVTATRQLTSSADHSRHQSGEQPSSRRESRSLRRTKELSSTSSSASSYSSFSSSSSSSSCAPTSRLNKARRSESQRNESVRKRASKLGRSRRLSSSSAASSQSSASSSSLSSLSSESSKHSDRPRSSSAASSTNSTSSRSARPAVRRDGRGRSCKKQTTRHSQSKSASSSSSSSSLSSSSASSRSSSSSSSICSSPARRRSRRRFSSSSRASTPPRSPSRSRRARRRARKEEASRSPPKQSSSSRRTVTPILHQTKVSRGRSARSPTPKQSYGATEPQSPHRSSKRTPTERLLDNLSRSHGVSLQQAARHDGSLAVHDQRIQRAQAGLHHARITADPLAHIHPPLPYFHSSTSSASEGRGNVDPSLQNLSLHEALQLRELLRARVRALHRAHVDALEGLRRRQWQLEAERREQEASGSAYYSEWTRQQYEEMQPTHRAERAYELERDEATASRGDGEFAESHDVPLTVPTLAPYWYERKDGGFCEQLQMYKKILRALDRTFFS